MIEQISSIDDETDVNSFTVGKFFSETLKIDNFQTYLQYANGYTDCKDTILRINYSPLKISSEPILP
jgi:hypothetical protein